MYFQLQFSWISSLDKLTTSPPACNAFILFPSFCLFRNTNRIVSHNLIYFILKAIHKFTNTYNVIFFAFQIKSQNIYLSYFVKSSNAKKDKFAFAIRNNMCKCYIYYFWFFYAERQPLWSSGQSSWLHNGDVLYFLWGTNWIYICYVEEGRPPLSPD
jgi:hypothetical protein